MHRGEDERGLRTQLYHAEINLPKLRVSSDMAVENRLTAGANR